MKHRIAVFSNGYNGSITLKAIEGIKKYAAIKDFDTHFYIGFAASNENDSFNVGQFNIYKLAKLEEYDGLIVFSGLLNDPILAQQACKEAKKRGIPVVSIGMQIKDIPYVGINNSDGMRELVEHLITEHGVKNVVYIGGTKTHVDSVERLEVVKEVMKKHDLKLPKKNIFYGDWVNEKAIAFTDELAKSPDGLPDVIICANDIMALAVACELRDLGYELPRDVIVTGFDHIGEGSVSYPALTTVDQDYETIGYNSCKLLYDIVKGKKKEKYSFVSSKLVIGESCGCNLEADSPYDIRRRDYCRNIHAKSKQADFFNRFMRAERTQILESSGYSDMKKRLREFYSSNREYIGDNYYVMLNRSYFENISGDDSDLLCNGYDADFDTTVALYDGKISDKGIDKNLRIPGFIKIPGEQHIYFFYPLHNNQYNYGYVVFRDGTYIIDEAFRIYEYLEKMEHSFMEFRINMRLEQANRDLRFLYDKDPMTGLYNRFCFVSHAIPIVEGSSERSKQALIMFIDINNMKKINDRYGHVYGDKAIHILSDSITHSIDDDDAIGIRFGGDEFLIIAGNADKKYAEKIKRKITSYIEKENSRGVNPFKFSISIGYVLTDPKSKRTVNDYVDEADRLMYEIKNEYHEKHPND
ncbi:diguanylate cyclase (GGDEF) domain-containing protein [Ruminococcaceae bacterium YAD3003]|nr:diguanylate cyclase (GGDEF) domain-containing protein [Ruminococcaceae bacterium YAD3003]